MFSALAQELWSILLELSPWLFLGSAIAAILKFALPADFVSGHLGRPSAVSVLKSVLLGVPMPLCSCGVIPTAVGLKKSGASNGAVVGFMISTPQTGADALLISAAFLGWPMALFMMGATFLTGIVGGLLVHWLAPTAQGKEAVAPEGEAACTLTGVRPRSRWGQYYQYGVEELIGGVYRYILIGVVVAAVISLAFPPQFMARFPILQGFGGMLGVLALAVPLYVCSNGSVPIAASLLQAGMPVGSALVFLMAGPATNVATLGAVFRILGRRVLAIYLGTIVIGSLALGWLFQSIWGSLTVKHIATHRHGGDSPLMQVLSVLAALFLLFLILRWVWLDLSLWVKGRWNARRAKGVLQEMALHVDGMTCMNCASHIKRDLEAVPGVAKVEVDLASGRVRLWGTRLDLNRLAAATCKAGYVVRGIPCP